MLLVVKNYVEDGDYDQYGEDENLLPSRNATARSTMNITTATNVRPSFTNDTHVINFVCPCKVFDCDFEFVPCITILMSASLFQVQVEESLPPLRPVVARTTMNMTTASTTDIHPYLANDTHVILPCCCNI